jgi:hypothetical protein
MPAMISVSIVLAVALFFFARACTKWGFIVAMRWAGIIVLCGPVFWLVGVIVFRTLAAYGIKAPSVTAWIGIGSVVLLVARRIAGKVGWGNMLGWSFSIAMGFSAIVVALFLLLMIGIAIHATVQGMVFIVAGTVVLMLLGHGYRARGR